MTNVPNDRRATGPTVTVIVQSPGPVAVHDLGTADGTPLASIEIGRRPGETTVKVLGSVPELRQMIREAGAQLALLDSTEAPDIARLWAWLVGIDQSTSRGARNLGHVYEVAAASPTIPTDTVGNLELPTPPLRYSNPASPNGRPITDDAA